MYPQTMRVLTRLRVSWVTGNCWDKGEVGYDRSLEIVHPTGTIILKSHVLEFIPQDVEYLEMVCWPTYSKIWSEIIVCSQSQNERLVGR